MLLPSPAGSPHKRLACARATRRSRPTRAPELHRPAVLSAVLSPPEAQQRKSGRAGGPTERSDRGLGTDPATLALTSAGHRGGLRSAETPAWSCAPFRSFRMAPG